ncbi:hypothetical protein [Microbacterium amylolyticum]|uniref:Uncharacterized protein n=1 Tax=Microbacterium amylolyticum TaxID=936337 RepID=A0ABS4ZJ52_9MICO|nr:hypothetical protein [Microbacterium amylolyticum]MBP2437324.1 hypothetical protein [Microbacterium amylolyticum]
MAIALVVMGRERWNEAALEGDIAAARAHGLSDEEVVQRESALHDTVIGADDVPRL